MQLGYADRGHMEKPYHKDTAFQICSIYWQLFNFFKINIGYIIILITLLS
jgi:hypothetical protein